MLHSTHRYSKGIDGNDTKKSASLTAVSTRTFNYTGKGLRRRRTRGAGEEYREADKVGGGNSSTPPKCMREGMQAEIIGCPSSVPGDTAVRSAPQRDVIC
eukprot:6194660-Pleurochrysis_carterae.AAC.3